MPETRSDAEMVAAFLEAVEGYGVREVTRMVDGISHDDLSRWRRGAWKRLSAPKRRLLRQYLENGGRESATERLEQSTGLNLTSVDFLQPRARLIYEARLGSYLQRKWPAETIERAAHDMIGQLRGANTLRSGGPGEMQLSEDDQVLILEGASEDNEEAYGPDGQPRRV